MKTEIVEFSDLEPDFCGKIHAVFLKKHLKIEDKLYILNVYNFVEFKNGEIENSNGIRCDGINYHYKNGQYHREDGPAIDANGDKYWYKNGKLHRENGPACEYLNGNKYWYLNGHIHREDGPAIERTNGYKKWFLNDKCHREDGPAVEYADGTKHWYLNGKLHREDGPAIMYNNGDKIWYKNGLLVSEIECNKQRLLNNNQASLSCINCKLVYSCVEPNDGNNYICFNCRK